jgi:hypothetical protein
MLLHGFHKKTTFYSIIVRFPVARGLHVRGVRCISVECDLRSSYAEYPTALWLYNNKDGALRDIMHCESYALVRQRSYEFLVNI